jgi:GNAT superfamily N-acetyltransferase
MVDRTVTIRQMRREDVAAVADLTTQLGYPATADEIRRRYDLIKDRSDGMLFVAQHRDSVVGWVHVQHLYMLESDGRGEIFGLVVADVARGTGVGRRLIEAAEKWAITRGLAVMGLRSNQLRTDARGFYEHLGYNVIKTQNAFRKNLV